jgi:hypothetical protein
MQVIDICIAVAFVGCLKNIKVQGVDVDHVKVVHSQLGVGLSLGDCDLVDWCRRPRGNESDVCYNGGRCVSLWKGPVCDCTTTKHYQGPLCQTCNSSITILFIFVLFIFHRFCKQRKSLIKQHNESYTHLSG